MPAVIERPKISQEMWDALKAHIMRERKRKKEEQEADAEEERLRRERERKQRQSIMTLDETKVQARGRVNLTEISASLLELQAMILQLQKKLSELTDEKHELFARLKKVLHEDDNNKRKQMNKENSEVYGISSNFQANHIPMGGSHPHMFMQGKVQVNCSSPPQSLKSGPCMEKKQGPTHLRGYDDMGKDAEDQHGNVVKTISVFCCQEQSGNQMRNSMYKVGMPSQAQGLMVIMEASSLDQASMKRQRSPSPPPVSYHHNYKTPGIPAYPTKHGPYASTQPSSYYAQTAAHTSHQHMRVPQTHMQSLPSSSSIAGTTVSYSQPHLSTYPTFRAQYPQVSAPPDAKHLHPGYLQSLPQPGIAYAGLLQQHLDQTGQKPGFPDERLYLPQGGSITSGYPVHVVHSSQTSFQPKSSNKPFRLLMGSAVQRHSINQAPSSRFY
ncbi:G protein pathway suppressor 2 [Nymphon striatum]|nr:G protein pathway suppressor 2 [Nymphon striatum]